MKTFLAGQDVAVDVLFEQDVDTVVPDVGSVTYTLYDNSGAAVSGSVDVPVTTTTTTTMVAITILAAKNAKTLTFETRTILVKFKINGGQRTTSVKYRITDFVPMNADCDSARSIIGMARNELPDSDIDLYQAYIEVCAALGTSVIDTALVSAGKTNFAANRAIVCRALLDVVPGIPLRTLQSSKSNTAQVSRFSKIDFDALIAWITKQYEDAAEVLVPSGDDSTTFGTAVIFGVTTRTTDPVTGTAPVVT